MSSSADTPPDLDPQRWLEPAPGARRRTLGVFLVLAILGAAILAAVMGRLEALKQLATTSPELAAQRACGLLGWVLGTASLGLVALSLWMLRMGLAGRREGRWPPPGVPVVKRVRLHLGATARARSLVVMILSAVLLALGGVGLPWIGVRLRHALCG